MSNKKKRNLPCPCGSGKNYKNCCMGLSETEIAAKKQHSNVEFEAHMQALKERQDSENAATIDMFGKKLKELLSHIDSKEALLNLGAYSLLPQNQAKEMRLIQLAQYLLAKPLKAPSGQPQDLSEIFEEFDNAFGESHQMGEIDTVDVIYISWVRFKGQVYRTYSGTIGDSETFFRNGLRRIDSLSSSLGAPFDKFDGFLEWALENTHLFIDESGTVEFESGTTAEFDEKKIEHGKNVDRILECLAKRFVFKKSGLKPAVADILKLLSKPTATYDPSSAYPGSGLYVHPVVDLGDSYAIPFPQLLLPAAFELVYREAAKSDHDGPLYRAYVEDFKGYLSKRLRAFFGEKSVMEDLRLDGREWMDYCVKFDGKLICISIAVGFMGDDLSAKVDESAGRMIDGYDSFAKDKRQGVTSSLGRPANFDNIVEKLEPMFLEVGEQASNDLVAGTRVDAGSRLFDVIGFTDFDYLLRQVKDPLELIRFLRAIHRLRQRGIMLIGATHIDLYAFFEKGGLQMRDSKQDPTVLMIDLTSGTRFISEKDQEYRQDRIIATVEGKKVVLRKHWEHFHGIEIKGSLHLFRFDSSPQIQIEVDLPTRTTSKELLSSTYLSFDSICYFLDESADSLKSAGVKEKSVSIKVTPDESAKGASANTLPDKADVRSVELKVGPDAYELFEDGANEGERTLLRIFAEVVGIKNPTEWVDLVKPHSMKKNFQSSKFQLAHKSYEHRATPTKIEPGDQWWVDEVISKAILAAGIKPGSYTDRKEIGGLATKLKDIAETEFKERLKVYPRNEVVQAAYTQLEIIHVAEEHKKYELLANLETRSKEEISKALKDQDLTQLSFANRYLLEATLQADEEGDELLTDEAFLELVALAERVVDIDFWGDTTYLGLQPGELYISEGGYPGIASSGEEATKLSDIRLRSGLRTAEFRSKRLEDASKEGRQYKKQNEVVERLGKAHAKEFGFTFDERIKVGQELILAFEDTDSPLIMVPKTVLIDRIASRTKIDKATVTKVIESLILSHSVLAGKDISPSARFWREERILYKPLVAMPANDRILLFSLSVAEKSLLSYYERIITGRLEYLQIKANQQSDLYKEVMQIVNESSTAFEDKVSEEVEQLGLVTAKRLKSIGGRGIPKQVGEVDGVFFDPRTATIFVAEIKDNGASRSPVEIKTELDNYFGRGSKQGYYDQLGRKLVWVIQNQDAVRKQFAIRPELKLNIKGLLVSNVTVASAILKSPPYDTVSFSDLKAYLSDE